MTKVKLRIDTRYKSDDQIFPLCVQISHARSTRRVPIGIYLKKDQWDDTKLEVKSVPKSKNKTAFALSKLSIASNYISNNELEIKHMSIGALKNALETEIKKNASTSQQTISRNKINLSKQGYLSIWGNVLAERALKSQKKGTADWFKCAISAFLRFNKGKDIRLIDIDEGFLEEFIAYGLEEIKEPANDQVIKEAWKPNTIGNYMSAVRTIMNKAIREKKEFILKTHEPFKNVTLPQETIEVDSITKVDIQKIRKLDLEEGTDIWKARARFLFMFNCQGLNFTDLSKLKVQDRVGNTITYYRSKTSYRNKRKQLTVSVTQEANEIWNYFAHKKVSDDYAFDILVKDYSKQVYQSALMAYNAARRSSNPAVTEKNRIKSRMKRQNKYLKEISEKIECRITITTYDARYGWVNAALDSGISEEQIGMGLGHSNLSVTRTYFEERHKRTDLGNLNEIITQ